MLKSFHIETYGCQMNFLDSQKVAGMLAQRGILPARSAQDADVYLVNTCSIRDKAEQGVYNRLAEIRAELKRRNPDLILGVMGCVAQQEGEELRRRAPYIDLVLGTHQIHRLPELIAQIEEDRKPQVSVEWLRDPQPVEIDTVLRDSAFRASITIIEGCNKVCSFCVVPYTRGRERSRPAWLILEEVRKLVEQGYVEFMLLGQNVDSYADPSRKACRFAHLLRGVGGLAGVRRVRFTTSYPTDFTQEVVDVLDDTPAVCEWVHLPVQSGSDSILRAMRRRYTISGYMEIIASLKGARRPLALSTDVIVGFPGETDQDFEQSLDLLRTVEYDSIFSFKYSPRPNTSALKLGDTVPEDVKSERLTRLQSEQRAIQERLNRRWIGRRAEVLVDGPARDGHNYQGRTGSNKVVNFAGSADLVGRFVQVDITRSGVNSLSGSLAAG
ncbi:MAG: tRNA (N6-isopentenyl adenosine(37)-C2)-methylthiotransferase MiaB [Acidobacteriota bacterium]